jgi:hypothetical protein
MPTYNRRNRKGVLVRQIREAIAEENRKEIIEWLWKGAAGAGPAQAPTWGERRLRITQERETAVGQRSGSGD